MLVNPYVKELSQIKKLKWYFSNNIDKYNRLANFFSNESIPISLIEWFVSTYCRKNELSLCVDTKTGKKIVIVYDSYQSQIEYYSKKMFDPYALGSRFKFDITGSNYSIITTICQLNYFKWLYENGIMDYIEQNLEKLNDARLKKNTNRRK